MELAAEAADHLYGDLGLAVRDGNYYVMYHMGIVEFGPDGQAARSCMGEEKWSYFTSMAGGGRAHPRGGWATAWTQAAEPSASWTRRTWPS
ncbi:MAG: hypothetical protein ACLTSG_11490 [Lachnospiraceae bacterium]